MVQNGLPSSVPCDVFPSPRSSFDLSFRYSRIPCFFDKIKLTIHQLMKNLRWLWTHSTECFKLCKRIHLIMLMIIRHSNSLCHKTESNMLSNDWAAVCWYHEFQQMNINRYRVVRMTHQNLRIVKCCRMCMYKSWIIVVILACTF